MRPVITWINYRYFFPHTKHYTRVARGITDMNLCEYKRKTWKGIMIKNVLKRRRECGTYLATARRHRRRLKMKKKDE